MMSLRMIVLLAVLALSARVDAVPGDVNKDGKVDLADYGILSANFGLEGPPEAATVVHDTIYITQARDSEFPELTIVQATEFLNSRGWPYGKEWFLQAVEFENDAFGVAAFIDAGMDPDLKGSSGEPVLIWAIENDQTRVAEALIAKGADVNIRHSNGRRALTLALAKGRDKVIRVLVNAGADVNGTDGSRVTPLYYATSSNNVEAVSLLLARGADVDGRSTFGLTALMTGNNEEIVQILLDANADVKLTDDAGEDALMERATSPGIVRLLLSAGADPRAASIDGATALILAAGEPESVRLLLDAGADPHAANNSGETALWAAASSGVPESIRLLLGSGASPSVTSTNYPGRTPLIAAASAGSAESIGLLLDAGVDVNAASSHDGGKTALIIAARQSSDPMRRLLAAPGINVTAADNEGHTALGQAIAGGLAENVGLLLDAGVDADSEITYEDPSDGYADRTRSPLMAALRLAHHGVIEVLAEKGANVSATDSNGEMPLTYAGGHWSSDIVRVVPTLLSAPNIDANAKDSDGNTVLILLARATGQEASVAQALAVPGIDANLANNDGRTALMEAVDRDHEAAISLLLAVAGINVNATDNEGRSALGEAIEGSRAESVGLLLDAGADPNAELTYADPYDGYQDRTRSPLMAALRRHDSGSSYGYDYTASIEALVEKGANVSATDPNGDMPLTYAAGSYALSAMLPTLLSAPNIDVNARDSYGNTVLIVLVGTSSQEANVTQLLATSGIDVNLANNDGKTALMRAAESGSVEVVTLLLSVSGLDVDATDNYGNTALSLSWNGDVDQLLQDAGASG